MNVGILGGVLAGLAVAAHLDHEYEVLERDARCGGHCTSIEEEGFTWDAGGPHIIFSRNQQMVDYMVALLAGNVRRARRNNKILYKGRYVKYPFENGLYDLDPPPGAAREHKQYQEQKSGSVRGRCRETLRTMRSRLRRTVGEVLQGLRSRSSGEVLSKKCVNGIRRRPFVSRPSTGRIPFA